MEAFLSNGHLGELAVGMPSSVSLRVFGPPESIGLGIGKTRIEAYCNRSLQISHREGLVVLIGIYLASEDFRLPPPMDGEIPFSGNTTVSDFEAYLEEHGISWKRNAAECGSPTILTVGQNVIATFENGLLTSLQSSLKR